MRFCSLSSCSYANSVLVQDSNTCILIDCGLRKRDIRPFLQEAGLSPGDLDAVLVTHCHTDHIYGLKFLCQEKNLPVYSTPGILNELHKLCHFKTIPELTAFGGNAVEKIGSLSVTHFRLSHDVETIGFVIGGGDGERMGFITDTGYVPESCLEAFQSLDYLYIESNHDVNMYKKSTKPWHVIRRNLGPTGHLSNAQCGLALQAMDLKNCKLVVLGHLSENDNEPSIAVNNARRHLAANIPLFSAPARVPGTWSDRPPALPHL
ncbi:MAG: putative metallo-hydrolase YycJ [Pelotomaculum sp. PtaB.Bin013]|nr:MAG: putative metallo-hydrolase YycJ [Pelotomaculum sp. PtaB.Bin013]